MKRLLLIPIIALAGCTSYGHTRYDGESGKPIEQTTLRAPFLTRTAIAGLKTRVSDKSDGKTYTRSVGLETGNSSVDAEGMDAINSLIGNALIQGLKAGAPVP